MSATRVRHVSLGLAVALGLLAPAASRAQGQGNLAQPIYQLRHWSGQGLAPVYEGWDKNDDGTFNMWFGYMNRNFEETLEVPVGPANKFEPGDADRGQPTFFAWGRQSLLSSLPYLSKWVRAVKSPGVAPTLTDAVPLSRLVVGRSSMMRPSLPRAKRITESEEV